jgi:hypothetical protein
MNYKKQIKIITALFFFFNVAFGQMSVEQKLNIKAQSIYADQADNLYVISNNKLIKYNSDGKQLFEFISPESENITSANVEDPLKILVFYQNQNRILFLDNQLIAITEQYISEKTGTINENILCRSTIGGYWLYDNYNSVLHKLNSDFKTEYSQNFSFGISYESISENGSTIVFKNEKKTNTYNYLTQEFLKTEIDETVFPPNIFVINSVKGKKKIFLHDAEFVYICKSELVKE